MNQIHILQPNTVKSRRSDKSASEMTLYDRLRYGFSLSSQQAKITENAFKHIRMK